MNVDLSESFGSELVLLGAADADGLLECIRKVVGFLDQTSGVDLSDIAFTCSRNYVANRGATLAVVASTTGDLRSRLVSAAARIADGAQNARAHVVNQKEGDAGEVDGKIFNRMRSDITTAVFLEDDMTDPGGEKDTEQGEHHTQNERHRGRGMYASAHLIVIALAEVLRDENARSRGKAREKADENIRDRSDITDRGICRIDARLTDHPRVDHVIKLLKKVAK